MKQAQEIIFVRKTQKQNHPNKLFNQSTELPETCWNFFRQTNIF